MWFWSRKLKLLLGNREYEKIISLCLKRVATDQTDYWTLRALGLALLYSGRPSQAFEWLTRSARANPRKIAVQYDIGLIYMKQECYSEACGYMLKALEGGYRTDNLFRDLGFSYYCLGELEKATNCFRELVRRSNKDSAAHRLLGMAYKRRAMYDEAIISYQQAILLGKDDFTDIHISIAEIYVRQEKWSLSVVEYQKALALDPKNFSVHLALGSIFEIIGENTRAIEELLKAHKILENDKRIHKKLERLLIN